EEAAKMGRRNSHYGDLFQVRLAVARVRGDYAEWTSLRASCQGPWKVPWWRLLLPRGSQSAARRRNRAALEAAHQATLQWEATRGWPDAVKPSDASRP